jgi:ParB-like chromosome segregation protein Spo0J
MPPLSDEEYAALKADIAERGVLVPVVVDQYGRILDGHHRRRIADELGIGCPTAMREVNDDSDARDIAYQLNLSRRQLNREQRQELIRAELTHDPHRSDRAIARLLGVDHKTVGAWRAATDQATRERAEHEERDREQREADEAAAIVGRVRDATLFKRIVWAAWVASHDETLGRRVLKDGHSLAEAAATVRRRFGCADLGCRHAPPPAEQQQPADESGEIPHLPDYPDPSRLGPYKVHPLRQLWPLLNYDDWCLFVASVREHGQLHPIVLTHDRTTLVDGRLRYLACEAAGVEPTFTTLPEDYTGARVCDYILSTELRVSLTSDQKAMAEAMFDGGGR